MNQLETFVYNAVRKNPAIKQRIRNIYQDICDILPRKSEYLSRPYDFRENYFFGFHDVSPLSKDETKLLAQHNIIDLIMPNSNDALDVGYFDFSNGKLLDWHKIGESYAWNYHKGCRLQWLNENEIIYNTGIEKQLSSILFNIITGEYRTYDYAIDSIYTDKKKRIASSFSYERLERCMPGYGYPYKDNGYINEAAPENTGLFLVDLDSGKRKLLLDLRTIALKVTGKIEEEYLHFVTHTEFSPDGTFLAFLYRRIPRHGDYMKRRSVMCVYSLKEERLIVLPSQESGSHYVWNKRNEIILSCNIDGKNCHALFDPNNLDKINLVDANHLNSDGHQSFINDNEFVTDTYPDKFRMASLFKSDVNSHKSTLIAKLYSPKTFQTKDFHCHIACDLHPRVIGNGKYVCFDSPRTGKRGLYVMKLDKSNNADRND